MYKKTEDRESERLLKVLMAMVNIVVLISTAFLGWSIYILIARSTTIFNIVSGNVLS